MTFNHVSQLKAAQLPSLDLQKPLTCTSPIIKLWKKIWKSVLHEQCLVPGSSFIFLYECPVMEIFARGEFDAEGLMVVQIFAQKNDSLRHNVFGAELNTININHMLLLVQRLKLLPSKEPCQVISHVYNEEVKSYVQRDRCVLGALQLIQLFSILLSLWRECHSHSIDFFNSIAADAYSSPFYVRRSILLLLHYRNEPRFVRARTFMDEKLEEAVKESKNIYLHARGVVGGAQVKEVPSLLALSFKKILSSPQKSLCDASRLEVPRLTEVYLTKTLQSYPEVRDYISSTMRVIIAPRMMTEQLKLTLNREVGVIYEPHLAMLKFSSLLPKYKEQLVQLLKVEVLKKCTPSNFRC
ncbi:hypothetical protein CLAVI_000307 [Candidatus Clavichlamydia salmonicola]|uniref:hypothetical protein n=1 Tax=Candidatus Clavichlamydia salmonicola TaxID=469812 RepID=UPI001890C870|nr:hypothetical protein [Candidatus Clavichlamydia salmonicola]MBF5050692.1 hypothetical protein [Candidatus Clavichlamydia salmonicola]